MPQKSDIEIGIRVDAHIYLHVMGNDLETPFDRRSIIDVSKAENGSVVTVVERGSAPYLSDLATTKYLVSESESEIKAAMDVAKKYEEAALNGVQKLIDKKTKSRD